MSQLSENHSLSMSASQIWRERERKKTEKLTQQEFQIQVQHHLQDDKGKPWTIKRQNLINFVLVDHSKSSTGVNDSVNRH